MLKCGQKNNTKYTFGITKEQKEANVIYCSKCGSKCLKNSKFCSFCGEKI